MYFHLDSRCKTVKKKKKVIRYTLPGETASTAVTHYRPAAAPLSRCYREREGAAAAAAATRDKTRLGSQIGMQGACALGSVYCRIFTVEEKRGQATNQAF